MRSRAGARLCRLSIRTSSSPEPTRQSPEAARKGLPALQERLRERCSVREPAEHRIHAALPLAVEQRQLARGRVFAGLAQGEPRGRARGRGRRGKEGYDWGYGRELKQK